MAFPAAAAAPERGVHLQPPWLLCAVGALPVPPFLKRDWLIEPPCLRICVGRRSLLGVVVARGVRSGGGTLTAPLSLLTLALLEAKGLSRRSAAEGVQVLWELVAATAGFAHHPSHLRKFTSSPHKIYKDAFQFTPRMYMITICYQLYVILYDM